MTYYPPNPDERSTQQPQQPQYNGQSPQAQQPYAGQYPKQEAVPPAKESRRMSATPDAKLVSLGGGCIAVIALVIVIFSFVFGGGPKYTTLHAPEMTSFAQLFPSIAALLDEEGMDNPIYFAAVQVDKDMSDDDLIKIYRKRLGSRDGRNQALYVYKDKSYYDKGYFIPDYAIVSNDGDTIDCHRITPDMLASLAILEAFGDGPF